MIDLKTKSKAKIYVLCSFFIPFIIILICLICGGYAPFGSKDVLTSVGSEDLLSFFHKLNLSTRSMLIISNMIYLVLCSLSGLFFYCFLIHKATDTETSDNHIIMITLSSVYSLSSYTIHVGMNLSLLPGIVLFPLIMIGFHRLCSDSKPFLYILTMAIVMAVSFQTAACIFIFCILYIVIPNYRNAHHFLVTFTFKLLSDIIIIGITCPVWFSSLTSEIKSGTRSISFPDFRFLIEPIFLMDEAVSRAPVISLITVTALVLIVISRSFSIWEKLRNLALISLLIFASYISTASYIISGLTDRYFENRIFVFILMFMLLSLLYESIGSFKPVVSYSVTAIAAVSTVILFCISFINLGLTSTVYEKTAEYKVLYCIDNIKSSDKDASILVYDAERNTSDPVSNILKGYNYVISSDFSDVIDSNLIQDDSLSYNDGTVTVYRNPDTAVLSEDMLAAIPEDTVNKLVGDQPLKFTELNTLASSISGCGDIFEPVSCLCIVTPYENDLTNSNVSTLTFSFDTEGDYYVQMDHIMHLGYLTADEPASVIYYASPIKLQDEKINRETVRFNAEAYQDFVSYIKDHSSESHSGASFYQASKRSNSNAIRLIICILSFIIGISLCLILRNKPVSLDKTSNRFEAFLSDNKVYFYTVLLALLAWIIHIFMTHSVPFGNRSAIISDGLIEDYPTATYLIDNVRHLRFSKVDYTLGFMNDGTSISSLFYFINPLRLMLLLFPVKYSLLGFNTYYAITFILIGPSMVFYLTHRPNGKVMNKHELKLIPIALAYTFSSFVLSYMHYNGFLDIALYLPLIMYALDRLIYQKKPILYSVLLGMYMIMNNYYAFLLCEFLIIYFFTLDHGTFKNLLRNGIRFSVYSVLAAGIAFFNLFGFYHAVSNGGYTEADSSALSSIRIFSQNLIGSLKDFEVMHRISLATPDQTIANTYCGLLCLLAIPLFACIGKIGLSERMRRIIAISILYFAYGNELLNFIFHGFHIQSMVPNRFSIFFIFLLINMLYDVILNYKDIYISKSLLSYMIFSCVILVGIMANHGFSVKDIKICAVFIVTYLIIVFLGYSKKKYYKMTLLLLLVLSLEISLSTYETFRDYAIPKRDDMISPGSIETCRALSESHDLKDQRLNRSEIANIGNVNAACLVETYSASQFSSTIQKEQLNLAEIWNTEAGKNYISYSYGNPLADIMLNVPYFLKEKDAVIDLVPSYFSFVDRQNQVALYNDPNVPGFGVLLPKEFKFPSIDDYRNMFEYQNAFSEQLIGEPIYIIPNKGIDTDIEYINNEEDSETFDSKYNTANVTIEVSDEISGDIYLSSNNIIKYLGTTDGSRSTLYSSEVKDHGKKDICAAILDTGALERLSKYLKNYRTERSIDISVKDNLIQTGYNSTEDSLLYIPVPSFRAWNIYIDGKKYTNGNNPSADFGGMIVNIPSGNHTIEIIYGSKNSILTYWPYLISLLSILIIIFINQKHKQSIKKRRSE